MKLILILSLFSISVSAKTLMISHKGAWKDHEFPQNTLASLERAIELGFGGIEFDVQITKDKRLILAHDDKMKRVSNCKGKISQRLFSYIEKCLVTRNTLLPISQILTKKVDRPQKYSSLVDVMSRVTSNPYLEFIWIDFKSKELSDTKYLIDELKLSVQDHELRKKIIVNSMDKKILKLIKEELPGVRTSLEGKWGSEPLKNYNYFFNGIGTTHDMISLNVGFYLGHEFFWPIGRRKRFWKKYHKFQARANELGVEFIGWTVNKKRKIKRLISTEIPYLLTDNLEF